MSRCRICNELQDGCSSLYNQVQQKYLPNLIEYCCGVKISPLDEPNALACLECAVGLIQAEHVIKAFRSTQDLLLEQSTALAKHHVPCEEESIKHGQADCTNITPTSSSDDHQSPRLKKHDYHFICESCDFETDYAEYFRRHLVQLHGIRKPRIFKCTHCPESYVEHRSLRDHIAYVHEQLPRRAKFLCSTCGKSFGKHSHLVRHSYVHNPEKRPFHCDYCPMLFINQSSAKRHVLTSHTEYKMHVCDICNKRYGTVYVLKAHLKRVHGVCDGKGHECPNCATVFQKQRMLEYHIAHECMSIQGDEENTTSL